MRKAFFIIILWLPVTLFAQLNFIDLEAITISPEELKGKFKQEKFISDRAITLLSTGVFSYQRGKNILWKTLEPIENELIIVPSTIANKQGGNELVHLDVNPTVRMINELFFFILTSEWRELSGLFELSGNLEHGIWTAELTPIDKTIALFSSRIALSGDTLLREITLYEKGGGFTKISFDKLSQ